MNKNLDALKSFVSSISNAQYPTKTEAILACLEKHYNSNVDTVCGMNGPKAAYVWMGKNLPSFVSEMMAISKS